MTNDTQGTLFDKGEWWEEEWQGMPEFKQEDQMPFQQIIVSFATREDVIKFGSLLGFKPTKDTKNTWFPPRKINRKTCVWVSDEE